MTFEHTERATTTATPDAVWALWGDPDTWSDWDPAVDDVRLDGPFVVGATGTMVLTGGIEAPLEIVVAEASTRYLDRLTLGELVIEIDHVVEAADGGSALTVTTTITGPGADDIGPMVTRDAPTALAALARLAESGPR